MGRGVTDTSPPAAPLPALPPRRAGTPDAMSLGPLRPRASGTVLRLLPMSLLDIQYVVPVRRRVSTLSKGEGGLRPQLALYHA
jgi:hypothetical protein